MPEVRDGAILQGGVERRGPQAGVVASAVDMTELAGQQQVAKEALVGRLYEELSSQLAVRIALGSLLSQFSFSPD